MALASRTVGLAHQRSVTPPGQSSVATAQPWGQLEYTTVDLQRPDEAVLVDDQPVPGTRWFFAGLAERQVAELFAVADLTPPQQARLADRSCWQSATNGWFVTPPVPVLRSLAPDARRRIYAVLAHSPLNPFQYRPTRVPTGHFADWLRTSGLPADKEELLASLSYPDGDTTCFADVNLVAAGCTVAERRQLAKALTRTPSLLMKLRLTADADLDRALRYWDAAGRGRAMKPLLESLARNPGAAAVNVAIFFPPSARLRLYTYPDARDVTTNAAQDCIWTALNFFNETPDNRFLNPAAVRAAVQSDYFPVGTNRAFGDLAVLIANRRDTVHMCIYVADDVVFTKNGMDPLDPWVLMRISDMLQRYRTDQPTELLFLRRRTPGSALPASGAG